MITFDCPEEDFLFFWISYFDLDNDYDTYISAINPRDKYLTAAAQSGSENSYSESGFVGNAHFIFNFPAE